MEHTTAYTYDEDNRVTGVNTDGRTVTYTYDAYGRVSQQVTKDGSTTVLTEYFTYYAPAASAATGQIATHRTVSSGYDITYTYTYDDNGNILSVSDGTNTTSYVYDSANQLIRENNQAGSFTHTWTYDNAGNILARREYAYTTGELGTPTHTASYTYGDSEWGDLLTGYDGKTITSDQIGNMLSDGTWNYTWMYGRKLAGMSDGSNYWWYTYDANGMRVVRATGITNYTYVYNGSSLSQMTDDFNKLDFAYDADGRPVTVTYNGTLYYYVTNLQGDVVAILNNEGVQVVSYTYDAWGNILSVSGSMANTLGTTNPLRYRGYVYDVETGLYYLQSRYYNPQIGRFINADGIIGANNDMLSYNLFAYCSNNPTTYYDSTGTAKQAVWEKLGFRYDGSMRDFKRLNQGLPPYAYEQWLLKGGERDVNYVENSSHGVTTTITAVNYVTKGQTKDYYITKSKSGQGMEAIGDISFLAGTATLFIKNCHPAVTIGLYVIDAISWFNEKAFQADLNAYESAMNKGVGVLVVTWTIEGARSGNSSHTFYYSWNGEGDPFEK